MSHKVFRDAIHDMIALHREPHGPAPELADWGDALLLELINTPEMQRLRRIRQLGTAYWVYPSAEHSRFSHALGVMHLAKQIVAALGQRHPGLLRNQTALAIRVAALVHDVGHGPYSHAFESLNDGGPRHEIWSWRILSRPNSGLRRAISAHASRLYLNEEEFLTDVGQILGALPAEGLNRLGRQIIASQLDADRMDYLLRDAHFTGVSYGRYDLAWLLHSLRAAQVEGQWRLCVDLSKGPAALESHIEARDHMYRQVYDHKSVRGFDIQLIHLFRILRAHIDQHGAPPPETPSALQRFLLRDPKQDDNGAVADYLNLDDSVIACAIGQWAALPDADCASDLMAELRHRSRSLRDRAGLYKRLHWREGDSDGLWPEDRPAAEAVIRDADAACALALFIQQQAHTPLSVTGNDGKSRNLPLALLVYVDQLERAPYAHLRYQAGHAEPVYAIDGAGRAMAAERISERIDFLGREKRRMARVYVDPRAVKAITALLQRQFRHPQLRLATRDHDG
ncbi:putative metal dependent phosphohydrolase [Magnetofaba australis IT-1]|uniref:Putative metal dependent phosphohydrolase n=1 Tax=Magnetofaba australis IT-1 TaxID=1434232 RepID=A0A1Y2K5I2_9PROT|nr:HD domain-containing protein [Magnetofaba australis]OSM04243.1 putative metal dependent phosphohydrolase [Magnetofaba australis IT-1]